MTTRPALASDFDLLSDEVGYIRAYCTECGTHTAEPRRHESYGHTVHN